MLRRLFILATALLLSLGAVLGLLHWLSPQPVALAAATEPPQPVVWEFPRAPAFSVPPRPALDAVPPGCITIDAHVTAMTTWDQPCYHILTTTVMVAPGQVLTIAPAVTGTTVYFQAGAQMQVEGRLYVLGSAAHPITLTAADPAMPSPCGGRGTWLGLLFGTNSVRNRIENATIEYACTAIAPSGSTDPADGDVILGNVLRHNGGSNPFNGAIGGDIDYARIEDNVIYDASNGLVLNEASHNTIARNTVRDVDRVGLQLKLGGTGGGNDNLITENVIYHCGHEGLRLEDGVDNVVLGNAIYGTMQSATRPGGALTLLDQNTTAVRENHVYSNGGGSGYRAALYVTGTSTIYSVTHNVLAEAQGFGAEGVAFGPDAVGPNAGVPWPSALAGNALCAADGLELRNATAYEIYAPGNRWGTPHPNAPSAGLDPAQHNATGAVDFAPWISLTLQGGAGGLVTVALRDANGDTVPAQSALPTALPAPDARRVRLTSNWGALNPAVVTVDGAGLATSHFAPGSGPAPATILVTATDFCGESSALALGLPDLAITKTTALTQAAPGALITYTLSARNAGDADATGVEIRDALPAGATYVADTAGLPCAGCTVGGSGPLVWDAGTLPAGSPETRFDLTLRVDQSAACSAALVNSASITATTLERDPTDNTASAPPIAVVGADLAVTKTAGVTGVAPGVASVAPGELLTYTLRYRNAGLAPATAVALHDTLPARATYVTDTGGLPCTGCTPGGSGPLTWDAGALPAQSALETFALVVRVAADAPPGLITNTVAITTSASECDPADNESEAAVEVLGGTDLVVIKDDNVGPITETLQIQAAARDWAGAAIQATPYHREFVFEGDVVTYTIAVANTGNRPAANVVLTETLPLYSDYVGHGWTHAGGRAYVQSVGTLDPGEGVVRYFVVRVDEALPGGVTFLDNLVCGFGSGTEFTPEDNCNREDTPVLRRPDVEKTFAPRFGMPGQTLTFTIHYRNPNPVPLHGVRITDTLPAGTAWISDTALDAGWTARTLAGARMAWFTPTLAAEAEGSFVLSVTPIDVCDVEARNSVTLTVRNAEAGAYFADSDTVTFTVACPGDLVVIKDDSVGPTTPYALDKRAALARLAGSAGIDALAQHREFVYEGDLVTYTIAVENVGPFTVTRVVLTETLPLYSDYVGHGWSHAGGRTYTRSVGTLAPGASNGGRLYYFVVRVHDPIREDVKNLINLVCGWGAEPDITPDDNCNYEDTPVRVRPLRIAKTAPLCISPGDVFDYVPWYTNTSRVTTFYNVPLTDTLDSYVTYAGAAGGPWTCAGALCRTTLPVLAPLATGHDPVLRAQLLATVPYTSYPVITNTIEISGGRRYVLTRTIDVGPDLAVVKNDNVGPLPLAQQARWEALALATGAPLALHRREFVRPGEEISYTILYVNDGFGPAHDVVLTEKLPLYTRYAGGGWHHAGGRTYTMALGTLLPGDGGEVHFYVTVEEPFPLAVDRVINGVRIATSDPECNLGNNRSDDDTPVRTGVLLYVANRESETIDVFRTTDFVHIDSFYAGPKPFGLLVYEDKLYVANPDPVSPSAPNGVTVVDLATHQIEGPPVTVGHGPLYLAALDGYVYVTNHNDGGEGITVIEHATGDVVARLGPNRPLVYDWGFFGITADPLRGRVLATKRYMGGVGLWSIAPSTPVLSGTFTFDYAADTGDDAPYSTVYNPETDQVYVTFPHQHQLHVYDAASLAEVAVYATQQQAPGPTSYDGGKGLVAMGACVYNANFAASSVTVLAEGPCYEWQAGAAQPAAPDPAASPGTIVLDFPIYLPLMMRSWQPYPHVTHVPVGGRPKGLAAGGGIVFVTLPERDTIAVLDAGVRQVVDEFPSAGDYPHTAVIVYDAPWGDE